MTAPLFSQPLYVMAKPAGPACNMACRYCYYLEKQRLYPQRERTYMSDEMLELFIRRYIEAQPGNEVSFTWHGGEALLRPLSFYQRAIKLQRQYGAGKKIFNSIQTNGVLLNAEWCRFLRDNGWLVGVSIDGPADFHDEYRLNLGGKGTFCNVMRGIRLMQQHGVEWNAMAVVNDYNADYPEEFYKFFKSIGCKYIQFTPIVERRTSSGRLAMPHEQGVLTPHSVTPEQWGSFLCGVFDLWSASDIGETFVQIFDATLAGYVGVTPGVCSMAEGCGHAAVMEYNGDVYSCDHFVFPEHRLGNIASSSFIEMMTSPQQMQFATLKRTLPKQCQQCQYLHLCHGECPKNRFATAADGEPGLNYLCEGYRRFFAHSAPLFSRMAQDLREG